MANDYPQIVDKSSLTGVFNADQYLGIGVEGQKDVPGTATVGLPVLVTSPDDAVTLFGATSPLGILVKFILSRGINYVWAVASGTTLPLLAARQAAWAPLEENPDIRIRLTDSALQADLVALADSCEFAEGIQHKQFCVVQVGGAAVKATALTAATAIASKRAVLTVGGVYDVNGVLQTGAIAAAYAACEIAKNPDITDSLNGATLPATAGVEKDAATGLPVFRLHAGSGTPLNDFQDLLTGGASPFQLDPRGSGLAAFSHLRTTWVTDTTFDALQTLLIKDQVFVDIRNLLLNAKALRQANTPNNRALAAALVNSYLKAHADWVAPIGLSDGTTGYGVTVVNAPDGKSYTVNYFGQIVRGTNVVNINGTMTIPA